MDFKIGLKVVYYLMVLLTAISCGQKTADQTSSPKEESSLAIPYDSIIFRTSSEEYLYLGKRLYPSIGSDSISNVATQELIAVESVGDTIFAFLNSELLYNVNNPKLPFATDSLLRDYYPKYYDVEIDDDIPYMAYLRSPKDYVQFIKKKRGGFYIETSVIRDTVINVLGEVKVGMSKSDALTELGIPLNLIDKESFFLILCHADVPREIWYKKDLNLKKALAAQKQTIQVYLSFEGAKLNLAYINPWIGYGNKGRIKF